MTEITIAYVRDTSLLTDDLVSAYVAAQQIQIDRDFSPHWGIGATCIFVRPGATVPPGAWQVWFQDKTTLAGALGFHTDDGFPKSYVFVKDCLDDGLAWTVTASHETLEMLADPTINLTRDADGFTYALEVCDAPEDDSYAYPVNGIHMSDFVLPSWFDPNGSAPFTFRNTISKPLTLAPGGYIGRRQGDGPWSQVMADGRIGRRAVKGPSSRTKRRFNGA